MVDVGFVALRGVFLLLFFPVIPSLAFFFRPTRAEPHFLPIVQADAWMFSLDHCRRDEGELGLGTWDLGTWGLGLGLFRWLQ